MLYESRGTDSRQQGCTYVYIYIYMYLGEEKSWKGEFWVAENFDEIPLVVSYTVSSLVLRPLSEIEEDRMDGGEMMRRGCKFENEIFEANSSFGLPLPSLERCAIV